TLSLFSCTSLALSTLFLFSLPLFFFFFNHPPTPEIYTLSLHDALPILSRLGLTLPLPNHNVTLRRKQGLLGHLPDKKVPKETLRSEEHTSELQSLTNLVCRLLLEKKKKKNKQIDIHNTTTLLTHTM